ncbi:GvpL/GvpF family gas vesicle protein [Halococcus hamelinensis]|uniref:Gas-vesicle operon protein gvpF n=1 Tax=Halococcus hamelinensis 100A6 TaxID=1132509 RepID=M0LSY6_9EURY|nr:GvpL/GvpF family gas vesicle protein [Halococcus hamelinensis]EMA36531.1 gas-vesicle operon protein gvpF [Halococcus hamelinensis 100A6]
MSDNLYAYGVVENEELEFDVDGVAGATSAYTVSHGPLAAVVTDIDTMDPELSDENARAHDDVLQTVLLDDGGRTVVPMQFGSVFKNGRALKNVLRGGRRAFTKALREIDGYFEFGVKLVADEDASVDADAIRADAVERFTTASVNEAENDRFSDRLVMNRSYLVDRDERIAFDEAVDAVTDDYGDVLTVQYTGPWPPYNFVDIEIGAQGNQR